MQKYDWKKTKMSLTPLVSWVKNWQAGELGIALPGAAPFELPDYPADGTPKLIEARESNTWYKGEYYSVSTGDDLTQHTLSAVGAYGTVYGDGLLIGNDYANRLAGALLFSDEGNGPTNADYLAEMAPYLYAANDVLLGVGGRDVLKGNTGDDRLDGGEDGELVEGGSGVGQIRMVSGKLRSTGKKGQKRNPCGTANDDFWETAA